MAVSTWYLLKPTTEPPTVLSPPDSEYAEPLFDPDFYPDLVPDRVFSQVTEILPERDAPTCDATPE